MTQIKSPMDRARAFTLFTEACSLMIKAAESSSSITEIQNDREAENIEKITKKLRKEKGFRNVISH